MFNLEKFREFIINQTKSNNIFYKDKNIYNKLLEALLQFEDAPGNYVREIPSARLSEKYKIMFDLSNKPSNSILLNNWFLYCFGYKKCGQCKNILLIKDFGFNSNTWNNLISSCKECANKGSYTWNKDNKVKRLNIVRNYRINNKEKHKEYAKKSRRKHLGVDAAKTAKRRATKLNATPIWLSKQQLIEIQDIYYQAQEYTRLLGKSFHVDHIIPLQGKYVSGLHVPWNLQILTAKENIKKSNNI